ncbi:sigma 54-interacting transcriptional regulator [Clostridium ganghwense]|uniref:Sigma 54-interacting transcriptional regulator n=1 Tax=Clostridium ganghwense TaxID=312089 RepID=A0ABT4CV40_9CLOT|nr:sigma 54-interacting transcriptional regulator [Clostridium ganghwense]MCY6371926.1 sigma 54-interacting transcriptional regulator [Clostridium ganghwense]
MKVKEVMATEILKFSPTTTMNEASDLFVSSIIDSAPVIDEDNRVIGIVTKDDMLKAFMNNTIKSDSPISEVCTKDVITVCENEYIKNIDISQNTNIPVIKENGELIGMLPKLKLNKELACIKIRQSNGIKNCELTCLQLDSIIESSYDGIYITDGKANTLRINKSYEEITGLKREDMLGKNMKDLEKKGYISKSATLLVLERGKSVTIQQKYKSGRKVMISSNPIFNKKGEISLVVTNVRDVTALIELEEQLEKNKELTEKYYYELEQMRVKLLNTADIVAEDHHMLETIKLANRVSKVDTTVLILGETGVGKEEISKYIHKNSNRKNKQFLEINCGAIPHTLIEAELFGYEKGAFTGANKDGKMGLFEVADGGTLFLDEIGELPLDMQVKLLRVLQKNEITRIGGVKPIKIDVRILAATNRNLEEMVREKTFREDLYYRLNVVPIVIPPLRERKQDIMPLIKYFLSQFNKKYGLNDYFDSNVLKCFYEYNWPGNVRELKNIVERLVIISDKEKITLQDLPSKYLSSYSGVEISSQDDIIPLKEGVERLEQRLIKKSFDKYGNVRDAAKALCIDPSTFVRKRKRYSEKYKQKQ